MYSLQLCCSYLILMWRLNCYIHKQIALIRSLLNNLDKIIITGGTMSLHQLGRGILEAGSLYNIVYLVIISPMIVFNMVIFWCHLFASTIIVLTFRILVLVEMISFIRPIRLNGRQNYFQSPDIYIWHIYMMNIR